LSNAPQSVLRSLLGQCDCSARTMAGGLSTRDRASDMDSEGQ
jgi:hypothetical protein